jgi:hypothetical protein
MIAPLWKIAAPELGIHPMMSVEDSGIYITRDDEGLVLIYSLQASKFKTKRQLKKFAKQILKQKYVDSEFLMQSGFRREYGATPCRVKRATPIRSAVRAVASRLSRLSPRA